MKTMAEALAAMTPEQRAEVKAFRDELREMLATEGLEFLLVPAADGQGGATKRPIRFDELFNAGRPPAPHVVVEDRALGAYPGRGVR
jgi:hypothetical protein